MASQVPNREGDGPALNDDAGVGTIEDGGLPFDWSHRCFKAESVISYFVIAQLFPTKASPTATIFMELPTVGSISIHRKNINNPPHLQQLIAYVPFHVQREIFQKRNTLEIVK